MKMKRTVSLKVIIDELSISNDVSEMVHFVDVDIAASIQIIWQIKWRECTDSISVGKFTNFTNCSIVGTCWKKF